MSVRFFPWGLLTLVCLACLVLFVVYPLGTVIWSSFQGADGAFSFDGFKRFLTQGRYLEALGNSILLAVSVVISSTLLGAPLAYLTARYEIPLKSLIVVLPLAVLIVPELIAAQAWLMVFGNNGILTRLLVQAGFEAPSFYGWFGLIFVMTLIYYVHVYMATLAALRGFDHQLEEAGQSLGTSPFLTRIQVLLPTIAPAILSAGLVVFTLVIGNFAVSITLGHGIPLLSVMTYHSFVSEMGSDPLMQSTLATVSIALMASVLFLQKRVVDRRDYQMTQGRTAPPGPIAGFGSAVLAGVVGFIVTLSLMPLGLVLFGAITHSRGPVMYWGEFSLKSLTRVWNFGFDSIMNSLIFASQATVISVLFGSLVSYLLIKQRSRLTPALDYILLLPLTISGTILGIALVQGFNSGLIVLTGTPAIMVLVYLVRRLPFSVKNASTNLYAIPNSIEEASISLGVPPVRTAIKVVFPLMAPGIAAAAILVWVTTIAELSGSVVVYSAGQQTLPIQIFRLIDSDLLGQASAYGLIVVLIMLVPITIAIRVFKIRLFTSE